MKSHVFKLNKDVILELQWIPPGEFLMGSPETEVGHEECESPQHKVLFKSGFWMSKYPVTQQQWVTIMGSNPSRFVEPRQPVETVSWNDVQMFIGRINKLKQGSFRLPTEAEWEYACRGATTTRFITGNNALELEKVAWYQSNSGGHPHQVGKKDPNSYGLYDMHGNVFEWTADWFGPYSLGNITDPFGPKTGTKKVLRGGCCQCDPQSCRSANRYEKSPDGKNFNIGFRVILLAESGETGKFTIKEEEEIAMKKIQVYDPPMCCSTGVCGPSVDEKLVYFSADLDWLKGQGFLVERYNLSQQPGEFVKNSLITSTIEKEGNGCLPIILLDGTIIHKGAYPARNELAVLVGMQSPQNQKLMTAEIRELVAIGAAIACNCETCFKYHYDKARKLGVSNEDMLDAVEMSSKVKNASAQSIKDLAYKYLKKQSIKDQDEPNTQGCSGSGCC